MPTAQSALLGRPVWYELMTSDPAAAAPCVSIAAPKVPLPVPRNAATTPPAASTSRRPSELRSASDTLESRLPAGYGTGAAKLPPPSPSSSSR